MNTGTCMIESSTAVLRFWGVRGSIPTPGPSTLRYGGNTTCIELRIGSEMIVIDAGSGIRALGGSLVREFGAEPISLSVLITHTHWDHIQGFPFFAPAFGKNNRIRVIGPQSEPDGLMGVFEKQMDGSRCFPVTLGMMSAQVSFEHLDKDQGIQFEIGEVKVTSCPTNHPGGCLAYRFETPAGGIAFLSDHETGGDDELRILEFIKDAKILIADAQYDASEMVARKGWGHGCTDDVVSLALRAGTEQLYLFHHDPTHDDAFIDAMVEHAKGLVRQSGALLKVQAAAEGCEISI